VHVNLVLPIYLVHTHGFDVGSCHQQPGVAGEDHVFEIILEDQAQQADDLGVEQNLFV
jgi:hypothetical protein